MVSIQQSSVITCPECGSRHKETMLTDSCEIRWECPDCGAALTPGPGDCCVYCTYGSVPCPPVQRERAARS